MPLAPTAVGTAESPTSPVRGQDGSAGGGKRKEAGPTVGDSLGEAGIRA